MAKRLSPAQALAVYRKSREQKTREAVINKELDKYRVWVLAQNSALAPNSHILANLVTRQRGIILRDMKKAEKHSA